MENTKITIFARGGLGPLQMVSEPNIKRCASEDTDPKWEGWRLTAIRV